MTELNIHESIKEKLTFFRKNKQIPNIIFHGPNGSGKHTLVQQFIYDIYDNDKELIKSYVMNVNCAHGKGIKFVRDELKFFAKTHINIKGTGHFKTIVLSNADKLTIDAQSAMRRCIELFSHTTRFFIIVDDKYKLLKPILSRFCEIFVPEPTINNKKINLNQHNLNVCHHQSLPTFLIPHFQQHLEYHRYQNQHRRNPIYRLYLYHNFSPNNQEYCLYHYHQ